MKRTLLILSLLLTALVLLAACAGGGGAASKTTLTAVKVSATSLDANADYWAKAPALEVATKAAKQGNPDGPAVKLQAVYDGQYVAIRAEWADPTASFNKNAWQWDGKAFKKLSEDEDRIMLTFPMSNNPDFASKGCVAACHNTSANEKEWWMGSEDPNVRYDSWHWKSARTHPAGWADDQMWSVLKDPADPGSSRPSDAKTSGGYSDNVNEAKDGPKAMSAKGPTAQFIVAGEDTKIDTAKLTAGAIIPGYIVSKPVGSRGDIEASGTWANGKWVVVQRRLLNTGHDDDAVFSPPKQIPFGLAVVDNGGGVKHTVAPDVLTLAWK